jgi:hypothetical protein
MSGIQFDEDQEFSRPAEIPAQSKFIQIVLKTGIVSTEKQAEYVLLAIAVAGILFTIFMLSSSGGKPKPPVPSITGAPVESTP